jgi:adenine-specific DNA-methyltransferase
MSFNYIGSKKSLINFIDIPISKIIKDTQEQLTFLDGFSGTGIVGSSFGNKYNNLKIIANDLEYYSYIINYSLLCVPYTEKLQQIIDEINKIIQDPKKKKFEPAYTLITQNYTLKGVEKRMFWTEENGSACDYSRFLIDKILKEGKINSSEYIYLIGCLLRSMDKLANTASVYGAFLKKFKTTAQESFKLIPIHINQTLNENNQAYNFDINSENILNKEYDIVYLDPPYNQRQYSTNYHPLNYIAKYDNKIEIYGKTGLIKDSNKSKYCQKSNAYESLENLVKNLKTKHILLSYNNEGIIEFDKIKDLLSSLGNVTLYKKVYKKFKSNEKQENENVYEYLFHLEKKDKINPKKKNYKEVLVEE